MLDQLLSLWGLFGVVWLGSALLGGLMDHLGNGVAVKSTAPRGTGRAVPFWLTALALFGGTMLLAALAGV
jgi:hypothetical protein